MRWFILLVVACSEVPAAPPAAAPPEAPGRFLETPAGTPPAPLPAQAVQLHVTTSAAPAASLDAARAVFGPERVKATPGGFLAAPASLDPDSLARVAATGARGNVVFWYPLRTVRDRLYGGGTAGLWSGILAARDGLAPPKGAVRFGGTPRLLGFAVSTVDRPLLAESGGAGLGEPATRVRRHEEAPLELTGPNGQAVDLVLVGDRLEGAPFERAIESLTRVGNQGGQVWVGVVRALAEPHVHAKF